MVSQKVLARQRRLVQCEPLMRRTVRLSKIERAYQHRQLKQRQNSCFHRLPETGRTSVHVFRSMSQQSAVT